jgi:CubicO group peptidase (beta-lactamase class C family)
MWAALPLLFQPGREWNYSVATDVLGRVAEVASGQSLDSFFQDRIFSPLEMTDTSFSITDENASRLAALYGRGNDGNLLRLETMGRVSRNHPPRYLSGGGGLISTAGDYNRFLQMLLDRPGSPGGELDGAMLLSPKTVAYMTRNHLPGNQDMATFGRALYAETPFHGTGFGLGFGVVIDALGTEGVSSEGEFSWGGAASTAFWVDPSEALTVSFFTQLMPSSAYPGLRTQLRQMVYQALAR